MSKSVKILRPEQYSPRKSDHIFFDTNIWLNIYTPTGEYGNKQIIRKTSSLFKKILESGATIYVSSLILSEFFNAYARIIFQSKKEQDPNKYQDYKKDFRNTEEFTEIAREIISIIKYEIMSISEKTSDNFSEIDIESILNVGNTYDFNDNYFCYLCANNNLKIVTADKDFLSTPMQTDLIYISS